LLVKEFQQFTPPDCLVDEWLGLDASLTLSRRGGIWAFPIQSDGALEMIDPLFESSLKSEYEPEIVVCLAVAGIELHRPRQVRGCFRVRAARCERGANVPVSCGVVRVQLQRATKLSRIG
jgi:hypothetical protein